MRRTDATQRSSLYGTARWQKLRMKIIARDGATCQLCGCLTTTGRSDPRSAEVDHKTPHKGDTDLFHDEENLWVLCKQCHGTTKQRMERSGRLQRGDGW